MSKQRSWALPETYVTDDNQCRLFWGDHIDEEVVANLGADIVRLVEGARFRFRDAYGWNMLIELRCGAERHRLSPFRPHLDTAVRDQLYPLEQRYINAYFGLIGDYRVQSAGDEMTGYEWGVHASVLFWSSRVPSACLPGAVGLSAAELRRVSPALAEIVFKSWPELAK